MILRKIKKGFTLVELVIVITILAILSTIGFISFQGYTKQARDSSRLAILKTIDTGLQANFINITKYPLPENNISVLSSGSLIGYQGYFGDDASRIVNINKTPIDPIDSEKFTYSVNTSQNAYQLLTFLESGNNLVFEMPILIDKSYAAGVDYKSRYPKIIGNDLGILLGATGSYLNKPIQELKSASFTGIDVKTYTGTLGGNSIGILKAVFSKESDTISGTGQKLSILDSSYRNKVSILMTSCSNGWTQDGTISFDSGGSGVNVGDFGNKVCEGNNDGKVPIGNSIVVANSSCPSGFDFKNGYLDDSSSHQSGGGDIKFNCDFFNSISGSDSYYSCLVCESKGFYIPSKTKLIMKECGVGYKYISDFTFDDNGAGVTFNSSNGNLKICEKL